MKHLVLLGDGMADWPLEEYGNRTPLEVASTSAMDQVARLGVLGAFCPIPEGLPPGSDVGNLSLFGYDPRKTFGGRAPIEAARQGLTLASDEVAFRCNFVTLADGVMRDFTAGHIATEEAAEIIPVLNDTLGREFPVSFHTGVSYRHIMIVKAGSGVSVEDLVLLECTPPHDITGQPWLGYMPRGSASAFICELMTRSQEIMEAHPVNRARQSSDQLPVTSIWLWGQGKAPAIEAYSTKFGLSGAVRSAVDLVKGIGVLAGFDVIEVPGATGWIDTNYKGKIEAALNALDTHDFVYVHVEAPDETAHQGRADLKIQAIEDFDAKVVSPALAYLESHRDDFRLLVAPDHYTTIATKTHAGGPAPFAMCGAGIASTGAGLSYCEKDALASGIMIPEGHTLVERFIRDREIIIQTQ